MKEGSHKKDQKIRMTQNGPTYLSVQKENSGGHGEQSNNAMFLWSIYKKYLNHPLGLTLLTHLDGEPECDIAVLMFINFWMKH